MQNQGQGNRMSRGNVFLCLAFCPCDGGKAQFRGCGCDIIQIFGCMIRIIAALGI